MSGRGIASELRAHMRYCYCRDPSRDRVAERELRDLLSVWRAAEPLADLIRHAVDKGDQVCGSEVTLMLAVERARRRGRETTPAKKEGG